MIADWRLDSAVGCNNLPPGGVVCGTAPLISITDTYANNTQGLSGGGAGYHSSIALHTLCRKHVVVSNGRVFDRGFTVNEGAMTVETSFTVPSIGQTFVLGFGGVRRQRGLRPPATLADFPDTPFPTPNGVSVGTHPYAEQATGSTTTYKDRRNGAYLGEFANNAADRGTVPFHPYSLPGSVVPWFLRVDAYTAIRYSAVILEDRGTSAPSAQRYILGIQADRLDIMTRRTVSLGVLRCDTLGANGTTHPVLRFLGTCYKACPMPAGNGEFIVFPEFVSFPHLKIDVNDPLNFQLLPGTAFAAGSPDYESIWEIASQANAFYTSVANQMRVNRPFRMYDGRFLVMPRYSTNSMTLYTFDPASSTISPRDPLALGLFLTANGGTTRWKAPVQTSTGTVVCLPDTFPGNTSVLYHPDTDTFERAITAAYPRADIKHAIGQPTADGRILYWQTYGAAADINSLLTVWPDELASGGANNDRRYSIDILEGLQKNVLAPFDYGLTVGDGTMLFRALPLGARGTYATGSYYSMLALDPVTMDYEVMKHTALTYNQNIFSSSQAQSLDGYIIQQHKFFLTPEFDFIYYGTYSTSQVTYEYDMIDAPATKSMGAFIRQAYFGYCF